MVRFVVVCAAVLAFAGCEGERRRASTSRSDGGGSSSAADAAEQAGDGAVELGDAGGEHDDASAGEDANAIDAGGRDAGGAADTGGSQDATALDAAVPAVPYCVGACTTASDCVYSDVPISDADNYTCTSGQCVYLGCLNTAECDDTFMMTGYVCRSFNNLAASCVKSCSTASDCALQNALYGADNYRCTNNACEWIGCQSSAECAEALFDPNYVCEQSPLIPFPNCVLSCSGIGDCGSNIPAYDSDNYDCVQSRCEYLGCNSDQECQDSFTSGNWICP